MAIALAVLGLGFLMARNNWLGSLNNHLFEKKSTRESSIDDSLIFSPTLTPVPTLASTPTPKPLIFAEMNQLYGPCVYVPTLMYHHVQDLDQARAEGSMALTVFPDIFREQMEYLRTQGYMTITMSDLISFFDQNIPLPKKSVILTFDDGYDDFASNAFPILKEYGFKATVFIVTGLIENKGYLTWEQAQEMARDGSILFANHTWSHHNVGTDKEIIEREITLADTQLGEHGLNNPKTFSYPHGLSGNLAEESLTSKGYTLAFTNKQGLILCRQKRFELPRIRIGNTSLKSYSL